ncbi:NADPH-dependent oxidoreductase [Nesterenkonia alkaliphila]|uniref:NADPH-dependent oxidoreductase n=1 Tax=Nesterenkonia alkaliphila TaxID=1463631 RepID=A0A7K1UIT6_9MICC|nr:NADPH-dependent oxidoreductase [Nesterenkonia alkaliphila]MVT26314.1 NADPH-dependent oxidoreductase [Nesterenkonia alkaliphila]GFZ88295.1 NADPH-dependent oxidoreductase [Nesterenkonia alkaliphila]
MDLHSAEAHLASRYGRPVSWAPPEWNPTLEVLTTHRSVRRYLDQEVPDETLHTLMAAAQSGPTSSNHQIVSAVAVRSPETKAALFDIGGPKQKHILQAPVILVWLIDFRRVNTIAEQAGAALGGLDYLDALLIGATDVGIAAQNAATAAESLGLGTVLLGSLRNDVHRVAELLELPGDVIPFLGMALGHPDPEEAAGIKPRLPQQMVLHHETYDAAQAAGGLQDYEETIAEYYRQYGLDPQWAARTIDRLSSQTATATRRHLQSSYYRSAGLGLA